MSPLLRPLKYDLARDLKEREDRMVERIKKIEQEEVKGDGSAYDRPYVTEEDIAEVVQMWTGIPVSNMTGDETARLMKMETTLHERIVGQEEAIKKIAQAVRRARAGLKDPKRPDRLVYLPGTNRRRQERTGQVTGCSSCSAPKKR